MHRIGCVLLKHIGNFFQIQGAGKRLSCEMVRIGVDETVVTANILLILILSNIYTYIK